MTPRILLPVVATALLGAACGDLSEEDLLFKGGVPAKHQLELQPAGEASTADSSSTSTTQALAGDCGKDDLRCNTRDLAKGLNELTFGLLDLIDRISNLPPTTRGKGIRVWGPYFDVFKDTTARFEISRNQDNTSFSFCLHAVKGRIRQNEAKDISCETDVDADTHLTKILSGTFTPGSLTGDAARTGFGDLVLRTDRIPDFSTLRARDIAIQFDNRVGRSIELTVEHVIGADGTELPNPLTYTFNRADDGAGSLSFVLISPDVLPDVPGIETATIDALWQADQGGRAIAKIETDTGQSVTKDQCWDRHVGTVYVDVEGLDGQTHEVPVGGAEQCVFSCDDFGAIATSAVDNCNAVP